MIKSNISTWFEYFRVQQFVLGNRPSSNQIFSVDLDTIHPVSIVKGHTLILSRRELIHHYFIRIFPLFLYAESEIKEALVAGEQMMLFGLTFEALLTSKTIDPVNQNVIP